MRRIENQELAFADLQYIGFSSFSTIDSKRTEFGHLHNIIRFSFYCFLPQDHKSLMPMGGKKYTLVIFFLEKVLPFPPLSLFAPWNATLSIVVIYSSMLLQTNCEKRLVIVMIPTLGYFFCLVCFCYSDKEFCL